MQNLLSYLTAIITASGLFSWVVMTWLIYSIYVNSKVLSMYKDQNYEMIKLSPHGKIVNRSLNDVRFGIFRRQSLLASVWLILAVLCGSPLIALVLAIYALIVIPIKRLLYIRNKDCLLFKTAQVVPTF